MIYLGNQAVGVAVPEIGEFKHYSKMTVAPDVGNGALEFENPLGITPKIVIITSNVTSSSRIVGVVLSGYIKKGSMDYNTSGGALSGAAVSMVDEYSGANGTAHIDAETVKVGKISSSIGWLGGSNIYTAELYA